MSWKFIGSRRPDFAIEPKPGQESVWDYPRPPVLVADKRRIAIRRDERVVADTVRACRVLETASPPTIYLPPDDIRMDYFQTNAQRSFCEWKGEAVYFDFDAGGKTIESVAWSYLRPTRAFADIAGFLSFYPARIECYIDDERVRPQPGGYYGGWMSAEIVGPVKGETGTGGW